MNWRQHLLYGSIIVTILLYIIEKYIFNFFTLIELPIYILTFLFFTLIPDVDSESSIITWFLIASSLLMLIFSSTNNKFMWIGVTILMLVVIATKFTKHRGLFHNPVVLILYLGVLYFIKILTPAIALIAILSFMVHLFLDRIRKRKK